MPLLINDRIDIALAAGAAGCHVGQTDLPAEDARALLGPDAILGTSLDAIEQARAVDPEHLDYVAYGPFAPTATKGDAGPPIGAAGLAAVRTLTALPLVAIGGIGKPTLAMPSSPAPTASPWSPRSWRRPIRPRPAGACARQSKRHETSARSAHDPQRPQHRGARSQRRRRYPGGHQGFQRPRRLWHGGAHGDHGAEHARRDGGAGRARRALVCEQLETLLADVRIDAIKVGMLANAEIAAAVAARLARIRPQQLVVDPVMVAKSGDRLLDAAAIDTLRSRVLPLATLITPNLPEAGVLLAVERPGRAR